MFVSRENKNKREFKAMFCFIEFISVALQWQIYHMHYDDTNDMNVNGGLEISFHWMSSHQYAKQT